MGGEGVELPWFIANPKQALEVYESPDRFVVLDYETTNIATGSAVNPDNRIVLACWDVVTPEGVVSKSKFGDEYNQAELEEDIRNAQFVVAHNSKFEQSWMRRSGIDLHDVSRVGDPE